MTSAGNSAANSAVNIVAEENAETAKAKAVRVARSGVEAVAKAKAVRVAVVVRSGVEALKGVQEATQVEMQGYPTMQQTQLLLRQNPMRRAATLRWLCTTCLGD